jgi:hypothetical protein
VVRLGDPTERDTGWPSGVQCHPLWCLMSVHLSPHASTRDWLWSLVDTNPHFSPSLYVAANFDSL